MTVNICDSPFEPWHEIETYQKALDLDGQFGATSVFVGTMRDFNEGDDVKSMTLEHYPGMTEKQLEKIIVEATQQWAVINTLVVHRVGEIKPGEPIVLVAVWTSHRGDAFDACRFIMEALKSKAPFWKKEVLKTDEVRWVESNTKGYKTKD